MWRRRSSSDPSYKPEKEITLEFHHGDAGQRRPSFTRNSQWRRIEPTVRRARRTFMAKTIYLVANGDLRPSANQKCWPVQAEVEAAVIAAIRAQGHEVRRGHDYDPGQEAWLHRQPEARHRSVPHHSRKMRRWWWWKRSGNTASICWRACCITRARSSPSPIGAAVARPGRPAQSQRLAAQGRQGFRHAVERGFHGSLSFSMV